MNNLKLDLSLLSLEPHEHKNDTPKKVTLKDVPKDSVVQLSYRMTQIEERAFDRIVSHTNLQSLNLYGCNLQEKQLSQLKGLPKLHSLDVGCHDFNENAMQCFSGMKELQVLHAKYCRFSDLTPFGHLPLTTLNLEGCKLDDTLLKPIVKNETLRQLFLFANNLTDESVKDLSLLQLDELDVGDNDLTGASLQLLGKMATLPKAAFNQSPKTSRQRL